MYPYAKSTRAVNGLYFDRKARSQRVRYEDFIELVSDDDMDMPPIVSPDVVSIDADDSGFGRCGYCLELCPAERHVSPLSGFAHCNEMHRGVAEDLILNDMEQLEAAWQAARRQLTLSFVNTDIAELIANCFDDDNGDDEDHDEVWEVDARQLALAMDMDGAVSPAPSSARDAAR